MRPRCVIVCGSLGTGKTTLVNLLSSELGMAVVPEPVEDNPYLASFYEDRARWAFHLQVEFLLQRFQSYADVSRSGRDLVADRSLYDDANVFVPMLRATGELSNREVSTYHRLYETAIASYFSPDLVVHLKAPVEVLKRRIDARNRVDSAVDEQYLATVAEYYESWLSRIDCPVLPLDSDTSRFDIDGDARRNVVETIRCQLVSEIRPDPEITLE